jgi:2-oxoglutarate ferredoxin oxidoreductase subunit delta
VSQSLDNRRQPSNKTQASSEQVASNPSQTKKVKKRYSQIIFGDWCKACGICSAFCPKGVIGRDKTGAPIIERPDDCIGCRFCELHCPDFAITIKERNRNKPRSLS